MIVDLAGFLQSNFNQGCTIYRITCDNFILLCPSPGRPNQLTEDIDRITERFQSSWDIAEKSIYCSVSGAAVRFPHDGGTTADIFRNLDTALYRAKESGKNKFMVYREEFESISSIIFKHREIEKMLYHAVKEDFSGFEVEYQPIHNSVSNGMVASEALLRYTSKEGVSIAPDLFIPIAEHSGLIIAIGEFVLRSAAKFCKEMIAAGAVNFSVSINVSIQQWEMPGFYETVMQILDEVDVPYRNIVLEITEGMAASNIKRISDTCQRLRGQGVQIALDDFGTGYSSLNMIRTLPIDMIKIDRTFMADLVKDKYTYLFIRLITELGHGLEINVCAEGVEEEDQLKICKDMGIDYLQGYLYCPSVPKQELLTLFIKEQGSELHLHKHCRQTLEAGKRADQGKRAGLECRQRKLRPS